MAKRKRKNAIVRYLTPFGLRQACDIAMAVAAILLIVGLAVYKQTNIVLIVGLCLFLLGALAAIYRLTRVLTSGINKRSPEYKSALVSAIIMALLAALAIVGLVAVFMGL